MKAISLMLFFATALVRAENPAAPPSSPGSGAAPARFLSKGLDERILALRQRLAITSRERGPFGLYQNPGRVPVINHAVPEVRKTPFIEFIKGIEITVINAREKEFLVGARLFRLGQVFPVLRGGEQISVRVEEVAPSRVTFKNLQTGELAVHRLDLLPSGVSAAAGQIQVRGVTPSNRGEVEPLRIEMDTPPVLP
ncbi:MAG: hypothetical protein CMO40_08485 [Verrucomicrobiaceae bacterium]|nr:hypothetical protein [Verrucomicrobiaceae bacterium]